MFRQTAFRSQSVEVVEQAEKTEISLLHWLVHRKLTFTGTVGVAERVLIALAAEEASLHPVGADLIQSTAIRPLGVTLVQLEGRCHIVSAGYLLHWLAANPSRIVGPVGRGIYITGPTATDVSLLGVFADGILGTVVQSAAKALVHCFDTFPAWNREDVTGRVGRYLGVCCKRRRRQRSLDDTGRCRNPPCPRR